MTWTTTGPAAFIDIGQGVTVGVKVADESGPAFVQVNYRGEIAHDAVDVSAEELKAFALGFAAELFKGLARKAKEAGK